MISKSEFISRVHGSIFPLLKKVEQERVSMLKKWGIGMILLSIGLTVAACYTLMHYGIGFKKIVDSYWMLVPIVTLVLPIVIGDGKLEEFSYQLKGKFIPALYDFVGLQKKEEKQPTNKKTDFEEEAEEEVTEEVSEFEELLKKGLFPSDSYLSGYDDDFFAKDNSFAVKEMTAETRSGRHSTTVFNGFIFEMDSDIKIGGKILILQKVNFMSSKNFKPKKSLNYQKTETNDAVFDNRFRVYTQNEIDAKSVLNKMFLRQIMSLRDIYPKVVTNLLIENGKITITFNTGKDMFEFFRMYRSLLKDEFFEQFYDEIVALYKVRDAFKNS